MEAVGGFQFANIKQQEIEMNGVEGRMVTANYSAVNQLTQKKEEYQLTMLFYANTKALQQVMVSCLNNDPAAKKVSERIINSVSINR